MRRPSFQWNLSPPAWVFLFESESIHVSSVFKVNILLNSHSLDISSLAVEKSDLGGDDCQEAASESKSSAQLMSDTSDSGYVDSLGFLASRELGWVVVLLHSWRGLRRITNSKLKCFKPRLSLSSVLFTVIAQRSWSQSRRRATQRSVTWVGLGLGLRGLATRGQGSSRRAGDAAASDSAQRWPGARPPPALRLLCQPLQPPSHTTRFQSRIRMLTT